tara:strand:- start:441 stop:1064 length:624 start_codon:yes stop_codon:yes gene_type:complete
MSKFFAFEGTDGCGKSTQIVELKKFLESKGETVTVVSPYTTEWGNTLHLNTIRAGNDKPSHAATILALMAGRQHLYDTVVEPALSKGECVIADRWDATTYAYNTWAEGLGCGILFHNCFNMRDIRPVTLKLDVDFEVAQERRSIRNSVKDDDFDVIERSHFEKIRNGYSAFEAYFCTTGTYFQINGNKTMLEVHEEIKELLCQNFGY